MSPGFFDAEIEKYRPSPEARAWDLPAWGHPLSQWVVPIFAVTKHRLFPIGTGFTIGLGPSLVLSAYHVTSGTFEHEDRLGHLFKLAADELPQTVAFKDTGLCAQFQHFKLGMRGPFETWQFETVEAVPPADVVIASPYLPTNIANITPRLGFDLPAVGQKIWSIGYCNVHPIDGIPLSAIADGSFKWKRDYRHTFRVVEGVVERIFIQRFASRSVTGPFFMFDEEIEHGQSGGPILLAGQDIVCGINSGGATHFADHRASVGSLMHPLLLKNVKYRAPEGSTKKYIDAPLVNLIDAKIIPTDGSDKRIAYIEGDDGQHIACPGAPPELRPYVYDDLQAFLEGRTSTATTEPLFRPAKFESD